MNTDLILIGEFNQTQDDFMKAIVKSKGGNLPVKILEVKAIFEFTDFKAKAWKMMTDKMKKLDEHSESYNSALRSGQKWGIAALYSQKRMGEITRDMPKAITRKNKHNTVVEVPEIGKKGDQLNNAGLNRYMASEAEQLANNPEILDRVIEDAKEKNEIPTKSAVLSEIRNTKAKERSETKAEKVVETKVKDTPREVKKYFKANTDYKNELEFAIEYAKHGLFSPESLNIIKKRHENIKDLMNELEELL